MLPETERLVDRMLGATSPEAQDAAQRDARAALGDASLPEEDRLAVATAGECLAMTILYRDFVGWEDAYDAST